MRTQSHLSLGDVPDDLPDCDCGSDDGECGVPGGGLCCPDDPLDLVLQFLPAPAPHDVSLAALGIGGSPSPRRQDQPPPLPPLAWGGQENSFGGAGVLAAGKSAPGGGGCGGSFLERDSLLGWSSHVPEDIDIDMFLADDAPDGGGGRGGEATVCNPSRDTGAMPMPAGGVHACGGVVSNDAPPLAAPPMFAGALRPYAWRAFDGVVPNDAPPFPAPMPAGGGLHAFGAASNDAPPPLAAPMSAGGLHAHGAFMGGIFSNASPAPQLRAHAPLPARPSPASSGSVCLSSTTSESQSPSPVRQPLAWVVRRKRRRSPFMWRKRPWSLDFPLRAVPETAPEYPGDNNWNPGDNNNGNGDAKNSCNNGGIRRRRPVPRQRNRQTQRVCSHCHSPDTPQWRAGPDGPGTLCNACGIRYAANKLLPEYRPSTAPSFRSGQHSNRHRKVEKLRKQKEEETLRAMADPVPVPAPAPAPPKGDEFMGVCTYISTGS